MSIICSCHSGSKSPSVKTQKMAEDEFVSSLTAADTTSMLGLTDRFMSLVAEDKVESAVDMVTVLYHGVVYKPSQEYYDELVSRFRGMNLASYELEKYYFTTEGNNDVCYRTESKPLADGSSFKVKVTFNPIKVDGVWYLALKDGNQSSKFLPKDKQVHELAPAPAAVRLNKKPSSGE